jgi:hypothetical protein
VMRAVHVWGVLLALLLFSQGCNAALQPTTLEPASAAKVCAAEGPCQLPCVLHMLLAGAPSEWSLSATGRTGCTGVPSDPVLHSLTCHRSIQQSGMLGDHLVSASAKYMCMCLIQPTYQPHSSSSTPAGQSFTQH